MRGCVMPGAWTLWRAPTTPVWSAAATMYGPRSISSLLTTRGWLRNWRMLSTGIVGMA